MKDKSILKHIGSILFFVVITIFFFLPQFQGKELSQGDQIKWHGMAKETADFHEKTGENVAWCGSMFSGMPGYTVSIKHNYVNALSMVEAPFSALNYHTAAIILLALVCGYILFITLRCPIPIAIFGAVAFALSSYFPIIIEAGHVTKGWVMATMPIVIASMLLIMKRQYLLGGTFFAFALTENIRHGHIQVTFYLLILCLFIFIGYLIGKIIQKKYGEILKSTGVFLAGATVAILMNSAQLYSNYEMSKSSIRGKSELTAQVDGKTDKSSGLDQDYAFSWSYGKAETFTFLIPNFNGGASGGELDAKSSALAKAYKKNQMQTPKTLRTYTYWGDQPFTSGPVYLGAIVCFLFVLSLFIVDKKYKWWVVAGTLFLIIMSWGKNFSIVNDFLFHHLPFYNKFRTPSMALIIPQLTFAWLGALALKAIYDGSVEKEKLVKSLYISAGITGGICLIFALVPSLFLDFSSPMDENYQLPDWYLTALMADRESLLTSDAWRSFIFIAISFVILFALTRIKESKPYIYCAMSAIALLSFIDLWTIDKRYLNESNFEKKTKKKEFVLTEADKFILQDTAPSYRVLTMNNPFNDTNVSYFHKSIGGYNAAKLRRYQDLIETHIVQEMDAIRANMGGIRTLADADKAISDAHTPVLDMLNMRYLILQNDIPAATNHNANGNAWFVDEIIYANNADEEISKLSEIDVKKSAIVNKKFMRYFEHCQAKRDSASTITMTEYNPMSVKYKADCASDQVAIFSEVYYQPGWNAYIDGKEVDHFQANWILRGLAIPAGAHDIEFKFEPKTYWNLTLLGSIGSFILLLGVIAAIFFSYKNGMLLKKEEA